MLASQKKLTFHNSHHILVSQIFKSCYGQMQWDWVFSVHVKDAKYFFYDIFIEKKSIFLETEFPRKTDFYRENRGKAKKI